MTTRGGRAQFAHAEWPGEMDSMDARPGRWLQSILAEELLCANLIRSNTIIAIIAQAVLADGNRELTPAGSIQEAWWASAANRTNPRPSILPSPTPPSFQSSSTAESSLIRFTHLCQRPLKAIEDCAAAALNFSRWPSVILQKEISGLAEKTVIINENLARLLWPGKDPLGRKIAVIGGSTVIGVVANVRHSSLEDSAGNEMYLDCRQCGDWGTLEMVVRSNRSPDSLVPDVRKALADYDPALPNGGFHTLEHLIDDAVGPREFITNLLGFFSGLALALAAMGLYGVIAYSVTQRAQEIGIRMAVGAQRSDVLRLVLQGGLKLVAIGVALGLIGSLALTSLLQSLLFGVTAHDPLVFAGNAALLFAVAGAACLIPALRAMKADPMVVLRAE